MDNNRRDDDYRRREQEIIRSNEEIRNMFVHIMGGSGNIQGQDIGQGAYMGGYGGLGAEQMRGLVSSCF